MEVMRRTRFNKWKEPEKGQYRQLIAVNLISTLKEIENNPPPIPGFRISRMKYLIHLILSHKQDKHRGAWSVLNMEYMRKIIPSSGQYLSFMSKEGIIDRKNYLAGRNSRLYRLSEPTDVVFRTITDQQIVRRIEKVRAQIRRHNSCKYPHLNKYIHQVQIDYPGAMKTIYDEYEEKRDEGRKAFCLSEIEKIRTGDIFIKVNKTNGRLDSNFTRLPSSLLPYLTIDDNPLIEMDISNSQPFFVTSLFNPTREVQKVMSDYLGDSLTMYIKSLELHEKEDVKLYSTLVTSGKFYQYIADMFRKNDISFKDKKELKSKLFIVFFGKSNVRNFNAAARAFADTFPSIDHLFNIIKKKGNNRLAILLQRIESYTMLERVVRRINDELPGLPVLTRHDSVLPFSTRLLLHENLERARNIMVDTITEVTGIRPQGRMRKYPKNTEFSVYTKSEYQ